MPVGIYVKKYQPSKEAAGGKSCLIAHGKQHLQAEKNYSAQEYNASE